MVSDLEFLLTLGYYLSHEITCLAACLGALPGCSAHVKPTQFYYKSGLSKENVGVAGVVWTVFYAVRVIVLMFFCCLWIWFATGLPDILWLFGSCCLIWLGLYNHNAGPGDFAC
eukprot:gnl/MRDRNA2_/MRDRNA2_67173_c0_seq1.p1 gnl/MRDRNA2_/MRDRNA2_67173_c0~~gnl/MRDRNA2_/MRDRNA2_67173_c0_seq1.p1  ORF type:complete len:114 (+),score=0.39 gnl/MRDRNA2_/MRDRNA2_67173_c0_seq1:97-438(+)